MRNYQEALTKSLYKPGAALAFLLGTEDATDTMLVEVLFDGQPSQYEVIECVTNVPGTPAAREISYLHDKYPTAAAYAF